MCSLLLRPEAVGPDVIAVLGDRRARDGIPQFEAEMERLGFEPVHLVQAEPMSEYRFRRTPAAVAAAVAAADFTASTGVAPAVEGMVPVDPFVAKLMAMAQPDGGGPGRAVVDLELEFELDAPVPPAAADGNAAGNEPDPFVAKLIALAQPNADGDGSGTPVVAARNSSGGGSGGGGGVPAWPAGGTPEEATDAEAAFQAMLPSSATEVTDGVYADAAEEACGAATDVEMNSGDSLAAMLMALSSGATDGDGGPAVVQLPAPAMALEQAMRDGPDLTMAEDDPFVAQLMALARANEAEDEAGFDDGGGSGDGRGDGGGCHDGAQSGGEALEDLCRDLLGALHTNL